MCTAYIAYQSLDLVTGELLILGSVEVVVSLGCDEVDLPEAPMTQPPNARKKDKKNSIVLRRAYAQP
jgi:hypothetical protein